MKTSIVMTAYKRAALLGNTLNSIAMQNRRPDQIVVVEDGYDGGGTERVCSEAKVQHGLSVEYYRRNNRPNLGYSNPAIPKNIGIKKATGDIIIIQCAEVKFTNPNDLANLVRPLEERRGGISNFALVSARDDQGGFQEWYAGPVRSPSWFLDFCQASYLADVTAIGGFDEQYLGYGFDDDDFSFRMQQNGVKYQWAMDVECHHQWHPIIDKSEPLSIRGRFRYEKMKSDLLENKRTPVANIGQDWGNINS